MHKHPIHKNSSGFTLIELLIVIAIIGILAAIAIPQFNQYKIRGYDTSAKQALRDVTLLCNAYWLDNDCSEECSLPKIKDAAYGFNQDSGHDINLPSTASQCSNFCASAKSSSSPNTYSIDGKALISSGGTCGGAGGSVQTASASPAQTFAGYQPSEVACKSEYSGVNDPNNSMTGVWMWVDSEGRQQKGSNAARVARPCERYFPLGKWNSARTRPCADCAGGEAKMVFVAPPPSGGWFSVPTATRVGVTPDLRCTCGQGQACCTYNFETRTYLDHNGNRWDPSEYNKLVE